MTPSKNSFSDLSTRFVSAVSMGLIAILALWVGGGVFLTFVSLICALMVWELMRMLSPNLDALSRAIVSLGAFFSIVAANSFSSIYILLALLVPVFAGTILLRTNRSLYFGYALLIMLGGFSLVTQYAFGRGWVLWFVLVIVATDVAGYFAGRIVGGPKLWPKVSPKKTWSGTVAGWVGAGLVGLCFAGWMSDWVGLIFVSVLLSFASQLGDIAESAMKRKIGVKDASNLIPGHGGFMDRFDGMIAAAAVLLIVQLITKFPVGAISH